MLMPRLNFQCAQPAAGVSVDCTKRLQNAMTYRNSKLASQELVGPQGGALERAAPAGQCALADPPIPGPWMLLLPPCSGAIPVLILGSSHSCFISEGMNYVPGRPGRSWCFAAEPTGLSKKSLKKYINPPKEGEGKKRVGSMSSCCWPALTPVKTADGLRSLAVLWMDSALWPRHHLSQSLGSQHCPQTQVITVKCCAKSLSCNPEETHLHPGADVVLVCACQQRHCAKMAREPGQPPLPMAGAQDSAGQQCLKAWARVAGAGLPAQCSLTYIGSDKNLKI